MARIVLLDSGPLGLVSGSPRKPAVTQYQAWLLSLELSGADIVVPEIADYEVRRELVRAGASAGLRRLDQLQRRFLYLPITTGAMRRACDFWALLRNAGVPTSGPQDLDAGAILAGQAVAAAGPFDVLTIATTNLRHLSRFPGIDAKNCLALASWRARTGV